MIGRRITRTSALGKTGPEILFIKRSSMRIVNGFVQYFSGLYLQRLDERSWGCLLTIMMLGQFEVEKIRQKIIKDVEEGVVIIPGFFDAEIVQKPDDVIIECLKIEEESNGNC